MMPIGPAPVISTSSPSTGNDSAVCTALPKGSKMAATSQVDVRDRGCQMLVIGRTMYSANAPGRLTPTPERVRAEMAAAGQAVAAASADDVAFAADDVAGLKIGDVGADLDDFADEFVADDHRHGDGLLRPLVPLVDVQVGAADAGASGRGSGRR